MIAWLYPAALLGLVAALGPILVHLLRRDRARRVAVPTVRFITPTIRSAVRANAPSDLMLLLVRIGIIAGAVLALARPLWMTDRRLQAWDSRIARAIVIDDTTGATAPRVDELIAAERAGAAHARIVRDAELPAALTRAVDWLSHAPPARREVVVLSHFRHGALSEADIATLPAHVGVRFAVLQQDADAAGAPARLEVLLASGRGEYSIRLDGEQTAAIVAEASGSAFDGLRILAPDGTREAVARLLRVVSQGGAFAPSPSQPIVVSFRGATPAPPPGPAAGWAVAAARRLLLSPDIQRLPVRVEAAGALHVLADVDVDSFEAARLVKAALDARVDIQDLRQHEIVRIPGEQLAGWSRPSGPVDASTWRQSDESDAPWFWGAVLVLLLIESRMRRSTVVVHEEAARAA